MTDRRAATWSSHGDVVARSGRRSREGGDHRASDTGAAASGVAASSDIHGTITCDSGRGNILCSVDCSAHLAGLSLGFGTVAATAATTATTNVTGQAPTISSTSHTVSSRSGAAASFNAAIGTTVVVMAGGVNAAETVGNVTSM